MSEAHTEHSLSIHRSEALADGIYAVAAPLPAIELKLQRLIGRMAVAP
jgi:hypothetical protein